MENSTVRKNKFPDLPEKVRNDKPGLETASAKLVEAREALFTLYQSIFFHEENKMSERYNYKHQS